MTWKVMTLIEMEDFKSEESAKILLKRLKRNQSVTSTGTYYIMED